MELRVAPLRIYNSACCMERFVFLGLIDITETFVFIRRDTHLVSVVAIKLYFIMHNSELRITHSELNLEVI